MMERFSLSDIEKLLDVKAYTIRYWEKEILLVQPKKDDNGRVWYSKSDLSLLFKLKKLIVEQNVSVKSAGEHVLRDLTEKKDYPGRAFDELRQSLVGVLAIIRSQREYLDKEPLCSGQNDN
jgi:DNA-binding transcriptional MerR regulator